VSSNSCDGIRTYNMMEAMISINFQDIDADSSEDIDVDEVEEWLLTLGAQLDGDAELGRADLASLMNSFSPGSSGKFTLKELVRQIGSWIFLNYGNSYGFTAEQTMRVMRDVVIDFAKKTGIIDNNGYCRNEHCSKFLQSMHGLNEYLFFFYFDDIDADRDWAISLEEFLFALDCGMFG